MGKSIITFIEKNIHGAWVIWGALGIRQYYYYTKQGAKRKYIEEARGKIFFNEKPRHIAVKKIVSK